MTNPSLMIRIISMTSGNKRHLCLRLADKSLYSLYKPGESGERNLVLTPASPDQKKNNISLFDCTGGRSILLREILLENPGDMGISFSLGQDYLSYQVSREGGELLGKGLIELSLEDGFPAPATGAGEKPHTREKKKTSRPWGLILLSAALTLALLLSGAYYLVRGSDRTVLPPLTPSEMTPR